MQLSGVILSARRPDLVILFHDRASRIGAQETNEPAMVRVLYWRVTPEPGYSKWSNSAAEVYSYDGLGQAAWYPVQHYSCSDQLLSEMLLHIDEIPRKTENGTTTIDLTSYVIDELRKGQLVKRA